MTDAPIQFDLKKCKTSDFNISALRDEFLGQGFNTLTKRLDTVFGFKTEVEEPSSAKATAGKEKEPEEINVEKKPESDQLELL